MGKRYIRRAMVLGILIVAAIASYFLIPTQPEVVAPEITEPPVVIEETPSEEMRLEGVILRDSGDSNPFLGTPWISVGCFGYVGTPIVAADVDILGIFETLEKAGLKPGQNILYTGEERTPKGTPVTIFIEWAEGGKTMMVDLSQIICDKTTGKPLSTIDEPFVFLGSYWTAADNLDSEGSGCVGCTVNCPRTLFAANKADSGYYMERSRYYIPEGILPPVGTKVTVIIKWT